MTEELFIEITQGLIAPTEASAIWNVLAPSFTAYDQIADAARFAWDEWLRGDLTRRNGMNQLEEALKNAGY